MAIGPVREESFDPDGAGEPRATLTREAGGKAQGDRLHRLRQRNITMSRRKLAGGSVALALLLGVVGVPAVAYDAADTDRGVPPKAAASDREASLPATAP
jgi:hypothetical protein